MSIEPQFRMMNEFTDEDGLSRGVGQFEENVNRAFDNVAKTAAPLLVATNRKTSAYVAKLDDLATCAGTFTVTLPAASAQNGGRSVGVIVESGTVTVTSVSGNVQGAATDVLATAGKRLYTSNGVAWWRAP